MNIKKSVTSGIIAVSLAASPLIMAAPAEAASLSTSPLVSAASAPSLALMAKAFKARTIKTRGLPRDVRYIASSDRVIVLRFMKTKKKVKIRGTSKGVQAKIKGKWVYIPYKYNAKSKQLVYKDYLRRKFNITKDPITGVKYTVAPNPGPTPTPTPDPQPTPTPDIPTIDPNSISEPSAGAIGRIGADWREQLLAGHNQIRAERGLPGLARCAAADKVAQWKANNMAENLQMSHVSVGPIGTGQVAYSLGMRLAGAGENIARGYISTTGVMNGWRGSSAHTQNILYAPFNFVGFGVQEGSDGKLYWAVELFAVNSGC